MASDWKKQARDMIFAIDKKADVKLIGYGLRVDGKYDLYQSPQNGTYSAYERCAVPRGEDPEDYPPFEIKCGYVQLDHTVIELMARRYQRIIEKKLGVK